MFSNKSILIALVLFILYLCVSATDIVYSQANSGEEEVFNYCLGSNTIFWDVQDIDTETIELTSVTNCFYWELWSQYSNGGCIGYKLAQGVSAAKSKSILGGDYIGVTSWTRSVGCVITQCIACGSYGALTYSGTNIQ